MLTYCFVHVFFVIFGVKSGAVVIIRQKSVAPMQRIFLFYSVALSTICYNVVTRLKLKWTLQPAVCRIRIRIKGCRTICPWTFLPGCYYYYYYYY